MGGQLKSIQEDRSYREGLSWELGTCAEACVITEGGKGRSVMDSPRKYKQGLRHMRNVEAIQERNGSNDGWLTCFKQGRGVGGAGAVIRDGCDTDLVLLATFQHADLTAGGSRRAVKRGVGPVDSRGSVQVSPKHQTPSHCHRTTGAAVVHGHGRHGVYG